MARLFLLPAAMAAIVVLFWVWALFDVITTDSMRIRTMRKSTWVFLVAFVPTLGAVAWVLFGRPEAVAPAPGAPVANDRSPYRSGRRPLGVEDSDAWAGRTTPSRPSTPADEDSTASRERKRRERQRREREAELARRDRELEADDDPEGDA